MTGIRLILLTVFFDFSERFLSNLSSSSGTSGSLDFSGFDFYLPILKYVPYDILLGYASPLLQSPDPRNGSICQILEGWSEYSRPVLGYSAGSWLCQNSILVGKPIPGNLKSLLGKTGENHFATFVRTVLVRWWRKKHKSGMSLFHLLEKKVGLSLASKRKWRSLHSTHSTRATPFSSLPSQAYKLWGLLK